MVWNTNIDPLNNQKTRNIRNSDRYEYNCGGYALETFSWYCPHAQGEKTLHYGFDTLEEAYETTMYAVSVMVSEFEGKIRMLRSKEELHKRTETLIAFRISSDGDFHYIKKTRSGWKHKMGSSYAIRKMKEKEVFETNWCGGRYDGPIVLLAMKKN